VSRQCHCGGRCDRRAHAVDQEPLPALQNVRYERFCQLIATSPKTGWPQGRCYTEACFKTADRSADACAARLLTRANIQKRIAELVAPTVRKTRATVDTLAEQFDKVFEGAMGNAQFGAAGAATAAKAKLLGFMREQIEVGAPHEFARRETPEQVWDLLARRMIEDSGPVEALEQIDAIRDAVIRRAAELAEPIAAGS
jgi:hypothetical protein